jgi:serine/threonine protein kinase
MRAQPRHSKSHILDLGGGRHLVPREVLGKGSSATVHRAILVNAEGIRRWVALKMFSSVSSDEAENVLAVLLQMARRVACVEHPNVARVYECGMWQCQPFVVSELVDGISLHALQSAYAAKQRRLPLDLALFVACEVAEGLAGARIARDHDGVQLGVLHQSISAREVLLSWRGEVKVTDFETSTARGATSSVRNLRAFAGRATVMAPEVAQGAPPDARSDVFSFGVLLRELFVGPRFPPGLANADAIRLAREGYVHPITFHPQLPDGLVYVIERALEIDPEQRYPNAGALAHDLRRVAFAMGVGDGRWFLRSALHREWSEHAEEITAEKAYVQVGDDRDRGGVTSQVVDLPKRRR